VVRISSYKFFLLPVFAWLMLACDGSAPAGNEIAQDNQAPGFITESVFSVEENRLEPVLIEVSDADGDVLSYEISAGDDQALFVLDSVTGELSFIDAPDYEVPTDANSDNIYQLEIAVNDGAQSVTRAFLISVTNIDDHLPEALDLRILDQNAGALVEGDQLLADYLYSDTDGDAEGASRVQWLRNGLAIGSANSFSYVLVAADVSQLISFEMVPVSVNGNEGQRAVSPTVSTTNNAPQASNAAISGYSGGVARRGDVLSGSYSYADIDGDAEGTSLYRWLRDGTEIASGISYTATLLDVGAQLRFEVTPVASSGAGPGVSAVSAAVSVANTAPVASSIVISGDASGNASVGDVLSGSYAYSDLEGDSEGASTFRWLRNGSGISGAANTSYTVTLDDLGALITFEVTPVSSAGVSPGVPVVSPSGVTIMNNPPQASSVGISGDSAGSATVGDVLSGSYVYSDTEGDAEGATTFRWLRDGSAIGGATGMSYTVMPEDSGASLRFEVTPVSNTGSSPGVAVTSASAVTVLNTEPVASALTISGGTAGTAYLDDVLTGQYAYDDLENDPEGSSTYRWLRDGVAITGATAQTYTVVAVDVGRELRFEVTPVSSNGASPGTTEFSAALPISNAAPVVSGVSISGDSGGVANVGDTLNGSYSYADLENDPDSSTLRWLRDGVAISGATAMSYTVTVADAATDLQFEVTPASSSGTSPGVAEVSAVVSVPTNIAATTLCTTNEHGVGNKLGVSRFMRFQISQSQTVDLLASRTSGVVAANPDLFLYQNGVLLQSASADTSTSQAMSVAVTAGDYVLELREDAYTSGSATPAETCYDISITYGGGYAKPQVPVEKPAAGSEKAAASSSVCDATGEVNVSGVLSYERVPHNAGTSGLDYASITTLPIRGAVVEVICTTDNLMYDTGVTDASGNYTLNAPNGVASFIRVKAQLLDTTAGDWDFQVVDNTTADALYVMDGANFTPAGVDVTGQSYLAASGWGGAGYSGSRVAAPFAILDSVYDAFQQVRAVDAAAVFPALNISWSVNNVAIAGDTSVGEIGTSHYNPNTGEVYVLGDENSDTDEYDYHVIIHEWAHYFEDVLSRTDSMGGSHTLGELLDIRLAFGEGFANAYAAIGSGEAVYRDSLGSLQASGFSFDIDNGVCTNSGWYSECSVHNLLYDFNTELGFAPLYSVLTNEQRTTPALTSIFSFVTPLKINNAASAGVIDTLLGGQSIDAITDIYGDSELNNNPGTTDQLPIYGQF